MADDDVDQGQGGGQDPPPADAGGQDPPDTAGGGSGAGGQQQFSEAYVKQLREEAAKHRKEARDIGARLKALEDGQLNEQQKLQRELDDLKGRVPGLERQVRQAKAERLALRAGALYPEAVAPLIPVEVDLDDDQAVEAAINALKPTYPAMFRRPRANGSAADEPIGGADGGAGGTAPPATSVNSWIRQQAGR